MAEWLGRGLQNLVQRFESASDLQILQSRRLTKSSVFLWPWLSASPRHCRKTNVAYWLLLCTVIAIAHLLTRVAGIIVYILLALAVLRFAVSPRAAGIALASNPLQTSRFCRADDLLSRLFCLYSNKPQAPYNNKKSNCHRQLPCTNLRLATTHPYGEYHQPSPLSSPAPSRQQYLIRHPANHPQGHQHRHSLHCWQCRITS